MKLRIEIKEKYISGQPKEMKFLPADKLEELVTEDVVSSAFKETRITEGADRNRLIRSVLEGRPRLFLILVLMTGIDTEKLSSLKCEEWDEIGDHSLPFTLPDKENCFTRGDTKQDFEPRGWYGTDFELFHTLQWPLLAPIFGTTDKFLHELNKFHTLPYLKKSDNSKNSGYFGEVWEAEIHIAHIDPKHRPAENRDRVTVAIKTAKNDAKLIKYFSKEAQNLERVQQIQSHHIIKPIAAYQCGDERSLLFPWAHGGNLADYWKEHDETRHDPKTKRWVMEQLVGLCSALAVLHEDAINGERRHGDLKPENILWFQDDQGGCLKIADMGLSTFHHNADTMQRNNNQIFTNTPSGTFRYEPPEMDKDRFSDAARSRQYDIWSMGCIVIELLVWLLYGYKTVVEFQLRVTQFWERTSITYYVYSYVDACLDAIERDLGESNVYRKLLDLVRKRVLIVNVSDEYKSSPAHREIASKLYETIVTIQQEPGASYEIPSGLTYPHDYIEDRKTAYFRPDSEDPRIIVDGPPIPNDSYLSIPEATDKQGEPTKLDDIWESIPGTCFARGLFNSLSWETVKPPVERGTVALCSNCNEINSTRLFKSKINQNELELSSQDCGLCKLLRDALNTQENGLSTVISLRQNGSVVSIDNGPDLLSIYVDPGTGSHTFQGAQLGLPKLPDHGSPEQFLLLKEWIRVCDSTHETCHRLDTEEADEKPVSAMPTRLVELGNPLRLVESGCIKPSPYVALSHCWGKTEILRTTTKNITQFMKSIDSSSLPKTFVDAIQVTGGIGIKYLWIDSLCIIQDSKDDWEHESAQMEQVFSSAYCTIAASSSKSSVEGFLHNRSPRPCVQLETKGIGRLYVCRNIDNFRRDVDLGELNSRGWVLQERALSRRTIFYTTTQVYWECGAGVHCETLARLKNAKAALLGDARFPSSALEYYRDGRQILVQDLYERYSRLDFTYYWDRPLAILGLQERLARAFKTKGAYGLFATYFARLLLWKRSDTHPMTRIEQGSGMSRRAPTWSWFSKVGAIKYLKLKFQEIDWATNDFENPFEPSACLSSGVTDPGGNAMTLRGQARKLNLPKSEFVRRATLDEGKEEDADVNDLRCVVIGRDKTQSNPTDVNYHTLIICQVDSVAGNDIYERVGVASLKPEHVAREGIRITIR
ncbi:hypothetical protein F5Y12DRAFT_787236 [Xylaria sp. FL1777]|nr:hypothetical protein F5Y12DRAFT_787236 [Xylaria sp. FL1777]